MSDPIRFTSSAQFKPGFGLLVSRGSRKWEFLNFSELNEEKISDLCCSVRFSHTKREMIESAVAPCDKAAAAIKRALDASKCPLNRSPFLQLPRELRDMIYKLVLVTYHPFVPRNKEYNKKYTEAARSSRWIRDYTQNLPFIYFALSRVCKIVSEEAFSVFYSQNHFKFPYLCPEAVPTSDGFFRNVREMTIVCPYRSGGNELARLIDSTQKLEVLHIHIRAFCGPSSALLKRPFIHQLLKPRGLRNISVILIEDDISEYRDARIAAERAECAEVESFLQKIATLPKLPI